MIARSPQAPADAPLVALVTERRYAFPIDHDAKDYWYLGQILADDRALTEALADQGLTAVRVDWADATVDWSRFACAVLRTTWDYFERPSEFAPWLERVAAATLLFNPWPMVRWNMDKHYLADLEARGVHAVPTRFFERGSAIDLRAEVQGAWSEAVFKPVIGGGARQTFRLSQPVSPDLQDRAQALVANEAMLLQPFMHDIVHHGETALIYIDGELTHAIRKTPKPGDFRVQDDHGGTARPCEVSAAEIAFGQAALAASGETPLYGRVDVVRDNHGALAVMELELIEPELWLRHCPLAAHKLAQALARRLA
jgi:glutathione synthase/RimK-type ligase-like ATP-grasp enzyme